jgi:hypothetical protein
MTASLRELAVCVGTSLTRGFSPDRLCSPGNFRQLERNIGVRSRWSRRRRRQQLLRLHSLDLVVGGRISLLCTAQFWQAVEITKPGVSDKGNYGKSPGSPVRNLLRRGTRA